MKLSDPDRLREEDPFTGQAVVDVPTHAIVHRSRFEFDLNRGTEGAIYETPAQAWGLDVWHQRPDKTLVERSLAIHASYYRMLRGLLDEALVERSLDLHASYYRMLGGLLDDVGARHQRFLVIDAHSYNHRRDGPDGAPTPQEKAPDINIGTFSMPREEWAFLLDPLMEAMAAFDFNGRRLDVRENVAFQGKGEQTRFIHDRYPGRGCAIALEFKKFFMDEWTGVPDREEVAAMRAFIAHIAATAERLLAQ